MSTDETSRPSSIPSAIGRRETVLITGATSFLGRLVTAGLLEAGHRVFAVLRSSSEVTVESMWTNIEGIPEPPYEELTIFRGDVCEPDLGLGRRLLERLSEVSAVIHLARPRADEKAAPGTLIKGHQGVLDLARRLPALRRMVVLSSTAVVGDFFGRFYEDWLDIGQSFPSESAREVMEAERYAREAASHLPVIVVRHALMVGHSRTGQIECEAGFSRLLGIASALSRLPSFVHPPGPAQGNRYITVSPIDFVAKGIIELTFNDQVESGETFCLADPEPPTLAELWSTLLDRVGAPAPGLSLPVEDKGPLGRVFQGVAQYGADVSRIMGKGAGPWAYVLQRGEHDVANATRVLGAVEIHVPRLATYLDALYGNYRRRHGRSS